MIITRDTNKNNRRAFVDVNRIDRGCLFKYTDSDVIFIKLDCKEYPYANIQTGVAISKSIDDDNQEKNRKAYLIDYTFTPEDGE